MGICKPFAILFQNSDSKIGASGLYAAHYGCLEIAYCGQVLLQYSFLKAYSFDILPDAF